LIIMIHLVGKYFYKGGVFLSVIKTLKKLMKKHFSRLNYIFLMLNKS